MVPERADDNSPGRQRTGAGIGTLLEWIALIEDGLLVALLAAMIVIAAAQILLRNFFDMGLPWGDQGLRLLVLWVALTGAAAASRENKHIKIDALLRFFSAPAKALSQAAVSLFTALVCAVVAYHAARFVLLDYETGTRVFGSIPLWTLELILPVGFGLMALRYALFSLAEFNHSMAGEDGR